MIGESVSSGLNATQFDALMLLSRWTGKLNGKEGIFPANFVEVV